MDQRHRVEQVSIVLADMINGHDVRVSARNLCDPKAVVREFQEIQ